MRSELSLKEQIVQAFEEGRLFEFLSNYDFDDDKLKTTLINLHNQGNLDLIQSYLHITAKGYEFFQLRHLFNEVLPSLEAETEKVALCIEKLVPNPRADLTDGFTLRSLHDFCVKDSKRPEILFAYAMKHKEFKNNLLYISLIAGHELDHKAYFQRAIDLLGHKHLDFKIVAINALSTFAPKHSDKMAFIYDQIIQTANRNPKDQILSSALSSLLNSFVPTDEIKSKLLSFLQKHKNYKGDQFSYVRVGLLLSDKTLGKEIEEHLESVIPLMKNLPMETVEKVDSLLTKWLKGGYTSKCAGFIEALLDYDIENKSLIAIHSDHYFSNFIKALHNNSKALSYLLTKWILSDNPLYREHCRFIVSDEFLSVSLSIDKQQLPTITSPPFYEMVIGRICGMFFQCPTCMMELVESLIDDIQPSKENQRVQQILFNFVVLSYQTKARNWLEKLSQSESDKKREFSSRLIGSVEDYEKSLKGLENLKELHPSTSHRFQYERFETERYAKLWKDIQKKSPLYEAFYAHAQTILYGNAVIGKVYDANGEVRRNTSKMATFSEMREWPLMLSLSPSNFDLELFKLRHLDFIYEIDH